MHTSLERRSRRRRNGNGHRQPGGGIARWIAVVIPLILVGSFLFAASAGFVGVVAAFQYYSQDLRDPKDVFENLDFNEGSVVYDRTGKVELARFALEKREVVTFEEIPGVLVDATTSVEDKTFWENAGFDPVGIISAAADSLKGNARGASTITQQLVRARLLPESAFSGSTIDRKIKEIIQSVRLTQEFDGVEGKKKIMAAYLNQNFYGNQAYGVKAAASAYFNKNLKDLTLAQAAILAAIPQSPTTFDLARNAVEQEITVDGKSVTAMVVPTDSAIVQRRNYVLGLMKTRSVLTAGDYSAADFEAAMEEPVILAAQRQTRWRAPHFVWQVRQQLGTILCGAANADTCEKIDTGGYTVLTTLDWKMQQTTEKWVDAAVNAPNAKNTAAYLKSKKVANLAWIQKLRGKNVHNGAAAVTDYRTGQVLAYVGSAGYYQTKKSTRFQPQFDVLSDGWRQPGSAIKPINYITGINDKTMTAASLFMDVVTDFTGKKYTPNQADGLERGPVRLRQALQFSLNIPSIKAGIMNGLKHVVAKSEEFGIVYRNRAAAPVISWGIGTIEVHPIDLLGAYGAIANRGILAPRTYVVAIKDGSGRQVWPATNTKPAGKQVASPQAAYIVTDILAGNSDPKVNPYWGKFQILDRGKRRPAAYKTGTTNDTKDLAAYGYLAAPKDTKAPALAVGVWLGNSDSKETRGVLSLDAAAPLWSAIMTEVSRGTPIATFARPSGIVEATIDAHSGLLPGPFTRREVKEIFIQGTVPTQVDDTKVGVAVDAATGDLWQEGCVGPRVIRGFLALSDVDAGFPQWQKYDRAWLKRAAGGPGRSGGPKGTRTSYFYNNSFTPFGRSWGAPAKPTRVCSLAPVETPAPSAPVETPVPSP